MAGRDIEYLISARDNASRVFDQVARNAAQAQAKFARSRGETPDTQTADDKLQARMLLMGQQMDDRLIQPMRVLKGHAEEGAEAVGGIGDKLKAKTGGRGLELFDEHKLFRTLRTVSHVGIAIEGLSLGTKVLKGDWEGVREDLESLPFGLGHLVKALDETLGTVTGIRTETEKMVRDVERMKTVGEAIGGAAGIRRKAVQSLNDQANDADLEQRVLLAKEGERPAMRFRMEAAIKDRNLRQEADAAKEAIPEKFRSRLDAIDAELKELPHNYMMGIAEMLDEKHRLENERRQLLQRQNDEIKEIEDALKGAQTENSSRLAEHLHEDHAEQLRKRADIQLQIDRDRMGVLQIEARLGDRAAGLEAKRLAITTEDLAKKQQLAELLRTQTLTDAQRLQIQKLMTDIDRDQPSRLERLGGVATQHFGATEARFITRGSGVESVVNVGEKQVQIHTQALAVHRQTLQLQQQMNAVLNRIGNSPIVSASFNN